MLVVGLTGRSGCGKTSVSNYYRQKGYSVSDGDMLSREVTSRGSPCLEKLVSKFGAGILNSDLTLNRKALGEIIFTSPEYNETLIKIMHPHIIDAFLAQKDAALAKGEKLFFLDGAVIIGGPVQPLCDKIIVVTAQNQRSVDRIVARDSLARQDAEKRLLAQIPEEIMRLNADYIIDNNAGLSELYEQADDVLRELLAQANRRD